MLFISYISAKEVDIVLSAIAFTFNKNSLKNRDQNFESSFELILYLCALACSQIKNKRR
jgi:hypothetical protein